MKNPNEVPPDWLLRNGFFVGLESYQRSLIIVSAYDDFEMEEIILIMVGCHLLYMG